MILREGIASKTFSRESMEEAVRLLPVMKSKILIVDLEATCSDDGSISKEDTEIIEIGAVLLSLYDNNSKVVSSTIREYQAFVRPLIFSKLTPFCKNLTSIRQEDVDKAKPFYEVFPEFLETMWDEDTIFASWGFYDFSQFKREYERNKRKLKGFTIAKIFPFFEGDHFNIKRAYGRIRSIRSPSLELALKKEKLLFEGTPHRGIDDARNIARIFRELILPIIDRFFVMKESSVDS